ncbi:MAG TPA: RagB/SusD family nutrient uptake outer membrane protein [Membranihabitans sp.]|nr:RagB/SusD family nutrient uptake outer membrane protein [Membranihabitans sp.]
MKSKYQYFILFLTMSWMLGCELTPVDYSELSPSIFPQSEEDLQALVLSTYYPLRGSWWDGINSTSERGQMFVNESTTEVLTGKFGVQKESHELSFNETSTGITYFYYQREAPYGFSSKISNATLVIDAIEQSSLSEEQKTKYIAEVRCARAFLSYILYDMFGPLVIAPVEILKNPLDEKPLPRLSRAEMVKFIEEDLKYAVEHLPFPRDADYGKFSKGLANMLLIRLYLHETVVDPSYYNQVEEIAREMMSGEYGYALVNNYPSLFEFGGQSPSNPEFIYVIPSSYAGPNENQWHMMVMPPDIDGPIKGWQTVQSTWYFYDSFEEDDTRKTYLIPEYVNSEGELVTRNNPGATLDLGPIPQKYMIDPGVPGNNGFTDLDIVMYRYADVLLSLAEAIVMKPGGGVTQEAVDLINQIRTRAQLEEKSLSDYPTKEDFIDQLLLERAHEFWCESGQYRADLIRFDRLLDRVMELNNGIAPYASRDKYLFPLPLSVIVDGKGEVIQNPGYTN